MKKNLFKLNIQLFAGEKTEKATPQRKREARKKGQVGKSHEITSMLVLILSMLVIKLWVPYMLAEYHKFTNHIFTFVEADFNIERASLLIMETVLVVTKMVAPILVVAMLAGFVGNVMQIGFLFTTETLKFDPNRINPVSGLKRMFSKKVLVELTKSLLKTALVGYVAFNYLWDKLPILTVLMDNNLENTLKIIGDIAYSVTWRVLLVLFIIAIFDYAYQLYEYEHSIKMSKQEIKEEYKNIEGDPQLKAKIKEKQRQLATSRMMQEVPDATVVITNPTHLAVALKYEDEMGAPVVIAKGQDLIAQKIKEIAAEHGVAIVENKPLARTLYKQVEIGMDIPVDLYQAVAEVIAYVYKLKKRY